jgi:hypothetical protein
MLPWVQKRLRIHALNKDHRLRVFENRLLRRIFGPKRERKVTGDFRKVHNEELIICTHHQMLLG